MNMVPPTKFTWLINVFLYVFLMEAHLNANVLHL